MAEKRVVINVRTLETIGFNFIFLPPQIILNDPKLSILYRLIWATQILLVAFVVGKQILKKKLRISEYWTLVMGLFLWLMISDIVNGANPIHTIRNGMLIFAYLCFSENYQEIGRYLEGTKKYCVLVIAVNLFTQIMFANGIYYDPLVLWQPFYFCGNANSFVFFYLFSAVIYVLDTYWEIKKLTPDVFVFEGVLIYSMILGGSTTGIVVTVLILLSSIVSFEAFRHWVKRNLRSFFLAGLAFSVWFIALGGWNHPTVMSFINNVLDENQSFSVRGSLWRNAIQLILGSPIFGYGSASGEIIADNSGVLRTAHNTFLQISIIGGLPALLLLLTIIIRAVFRLKNSKDNMCYYAIIFVCLYCLAFLVEQNPFYIGFYALIGLSDRFAGENFTLKEHFETKAMNTCHEQKPC